jgi:hypothetical protein
MSNTTRTKKFYADAISYNTKKGCKMPGFSAHPYNSKEFAKDVSDFQKQQKLEFDGKFGPTTLSYARQEYMEKSPIIAVTLKDKMDIIYEVRKFEGQFWSANRDGEFAGKFDRPGSKHWASGKVHIGLSFGFIQFTQDGGMLGKLLKEMNNVNHDKFVGLFGNNWSDLLKVTNAVGSTRDNGRSPRVQPVGGYDLWNDYWVNKFYLAGKDVEFQECQIRLACDNYMEPAVKICKDFNLKSQRSLAIVFDRCVQYGPAGARRLFESAYNNEAEHIFLNNLVQKWKKYRWSHRTQKLFSSPFLRDHQLQL